MDGRDVSTTSGVGFIKDLQAKMAEIGVGKIASVMGRYYAMDRDFAWDRVEKAYAAMVYGEGNKNSDPVAAVRASYEEIDAEGKNITDEFVIPTVCTENATVKANDSVVFYNFRPDRAREITRTFVDGDFAGFERRNGFFPLYYVCMTQYDATMPNVHVAFKPQTLENTLGEYLAKMGKTQLRIAETEKYAHVTFFFNGGVEKQYEGEDRILVASPKVATYDLQPEMSAYEVTDKVVEAIKSDKYDVIILNFANCDMVGHTGIFEAAVAAVEAVDECLGEVMSAIKEVNGVLLVTADHGNAEKMVDETTGAPYTAHTVGKVQAVLFNSDENVKSMNNGRLADIAPTLLDLMDIEKPVEMTGNSLIVK